MKGRGTTVEFELDGPAYGTALVAQDDSVWVAIQPKWWDLATWIWWWFCPSDKKSVVNLRTYDGLGGNVLVRSRAVRVATKFVRVKGMPKLERRKWGK